MPGIPKDSIVSGFAGVLHSYDCRVCSIGDLLLGCQNATTIASGAWPVGSQAFYYAFYVESPCIAKRMMVYNGATVSGNLDMGIFNWAGLKLASTGSTAQAGTSVPQAIDITDTLLMPGSYWMGLVLDNTTGTTIRANTGLGYVYAICGAVREASAFPLPATATLTGSAGTHHHLFGIDLKAVH